MGVYIILFYNWKYRHGIKIKSKLKRKVTFFISQNGWNLKQNNVTLNEQRPCRLISIMSTFIPLKICTESVLVPLSYCHHENKLLLEERKVRHSYVLSLVLTLSHIEEFLKYFMLPEKKEVEQELGNFVPCISGLSCEKNDIVLTTNKSRFVTVFRDCED